MSLHQATFRVRHECPYRDLSERHPDLTVREWFLSECQVLEVTTGAEPSDALLEDVSALGTVLHSAATDDGLYVVMRSCECSLEDSIVQRFEDHNCLYRPPTVYRQGWEHYTVIAFDERDVHALLGELDDAREITVLSKTEMDTRRVPHSMLTSVGRVLDGLTDRQLQALEIALDNGYYDQPRGASIAELAGKTDLARSTFEEHLRKAENKLLTNTGQFVRLATQADTVATASSGPVPTGTPQSGP